MSTIVYLLEILKSMLQASVMDDTIFKVVFPTFHILGPGNLFHVKGKKLYENFTKGQNMFF